MFTGESASQTHHFFEEVGRCLINPPSFVFVVVEEVHVEVSVAGVPVAKGINAVRFADALHFIDENADTAHIDAWLDRFGDAIRLWTDRWLARDGLPQARLTLMDHEGEPMVYDSRSGEETFTSLRPAEADLITFLEEPRAQSSIEKEFGDAGTLLDSFRERGWIFEENRRLMSLLTGVEPA